jgi:hypothetical protein
MTTTVQQIIEGAYAKSTANDPGRLATDAELLTRLARTYALMTALLARQRPDEWTSTTSVTLAGADVGFDVPADTIEIRRIQNAQGKQVHLIPSNERERTTHIAPSMFQQGQRVSSRLLGGDPAAADVLSVLWLAPATGLTTLAQTIDPRFPLRHVEVLVGDLALYLDTKDDERDPGSFQKLAADHTFHLQSVAAEYNLEASALEFMHGAVTRVRAPVTGAAG